MGTGQFRPGDTANPNIGSVGALEEVKEARVETLCVGEDVAKKAVDALKKSVLPFMIFSFEHNTLDLVKLPGQSNGLFRAHPYEEPAYELYKVEDL